MKNKNLKKTELLAPVGTFESLKAAVNSGCDAVYFGGKSFNARQYASNFDDDDVKKIIDYCHARGVKVRVTLNILYKNNEINDVLEFVSKLYKFGADALIVQDVGIFRLIKKHFPEIRLHASTQMTVHCKGGVEFLKNWGFDRVVLSRELSLNEIADITNSVDIEIETFVHGAICVSYSGRCLMSSIIGERSGNRGRCAQPCRMRYAVLKNQDKKPVSEGYLISPKDMATYPITDKLINAGINTFKIEGRMKSPEYVGLVVSDYRKYIDQVYQNNFKVDKQDIKELTQIFNRGGSSETGYYNCYAGLDMISSSPKSSGIKIGQVIDFNKKSKWCKIQLDEDVFCGDGIEIWTKIEPHTGTNISKNGKRGEVINLKLDGNINKGDLVYKSYDKVLDDRLKHCYEKDTRQQVIKASVKAELNKPLWIKLETQDGVSIEYQENLIEKAQKNPFDVDRFITQLSKTGSTPFKFEFIDCKTQNDIYIPIKALNEFRRNAIEKLYNEIIKSYERQEIKIKYDFKKPIKADKSGISVMVSDLSQLESAIKFDIQRIYIEMKKDFIDNLDMICHECHKKNIQVFMAMPWIERDLYKKEIDEKIAICEKSQIDGYLLRNYDGFKTKKLKVADFTFNAFNSASVEALSEFVDEVCLSPELNVKELNEICSDKNEIFAYGRLPLMTTHQCPVGLYGGSKKNGRFCKLKGNTDNYYLKDRKNVKFPIKTDCDCCLSVILNSNPIFVLHKFKEIINLKAGLYRLSFTDESNNEVEEIVYGYSKMLKTGFADEKINNLIKKMSEEKGATNGHFFRGVL